MTFWQGTLLGIMLQAAMMALVWWLPPDFGFWGSISLIASTSILLIFMLVSVVSDGIGERRNLGSVLIIALMWVTSVTYYFAIIYRAVGVVSDGRIVRDFGDAMYFSIVTWTTLGYGDITPSEAARPFAAAEAALGYVVMALLIAALVAALQDHRR